MKNDYFELDSRENPEKDCPFYFGVVNSRYNEALMNEDIVRILKQGVQKDFGTGWRYEGDFKDSFVKKLKLPETKVLPCRRFENARLIEKIFTHRGDSANVPAPYGLIFSGDAMEILSGNAEAFYIAEEIQGPNLFNTIGKMTARDREQFFKVMGIELGRLSQRGIYMMEIAPKDIVLANGDLTKPYFVDTEEVTFSDNRGDEREKRELIEKQIKQFEEDFGLFLSQGNLKTAVKNCFKEQ